MEDFTGLRFQQREIKVITHKDRSWSGMDGKPMRLSTYNSSVESKQIALTHELAHRLLFGNNLYAPEPDSADGDEIRAYLIQDNTLQKVFGGETYNLWSTFDPKVHGNDHSRLVAPLLNLDSSQRRAMFLDLIKSGKTP